MKFFHHMRIYLANPLLWSVMATMARGAMIQEVDPTCAVLTTLKNETQVFPKPAEDDDTVVHFLLRYNIRTLGQRSNESRFDITQEVGQELVQQLGNSLLSHCNENAVTTATSVRLAQSGDALPCRDSISVNSTSSTAEARPDESCFTITSDLFVYGEPSEEILETEINNLLPLILESELSSNETITDAVRNIEFQPVELVLDSSTEKETDEETTSGGAGGFFGIVRSQLSRNKVVVIFLSILILLSITGCCIYRRKFASKSNTNVSGSIPV